MSDAFAEAISTDDSVPVHDNPHHALLGDPETEGNEELDLAEDDTDEPMDDHLQDDIHTPLNSSDVQF